MGPGHLSRALAVSLTLGLVGTLLRLKAAGRSSSEVLWGAEAGVPTTTGAENSKPESLAGRREGPRRAPVCPRMRSCMLDRNTACKPTLCLSRAAVSNSLRTHGLQPNRLLRAWNSPGKNTGVGCHVLVQGIFPRKAVYPHQFSSVPSLSRVSLFATPWTAARRASLPITNSRNLLKLRSIQSVMPSSPLILCHPLLLPPSIFPSIRVFSSESGKDFTSGGQRTGVSASASVLPMNTQD